VRQLNQEVPRRLAPILDSLVEEEPVIALHGPRSVGKSTLLRRLAESRGVEVLDLDDPAVRDAVTASPGLAVSGTDLVCIDEYQHVPALLDALKAKLNANGSAPGTAVITGSTRQDAIPRTAQTLTGRLHSITIWPLSQGEIDSNREGMLSGLSDDSDGFVAARTQSATTRAEYVQRVCRGGLPLAGDEAGRLGTAGSTTTSVSRSNATPQSWSRSNSGNFSVLS